MHRQRYGRIKMFRSNKKVSVLKNNLYFIGIIWKISPLRVILNFFSVFFDFALWTFYSVVFMQYLFSESQKSFKDVFVFIWFAVLINLVSKLFYAWYNNIYAPKNDIKIHYHINSMVFKKALSVDLSCFEDPEFYDNYTKAATEAASRANSVLSYCSMVVASFISSVFVIITMAKITLWALLFIALPLIGNLYFGKKAGKENFNIEQESVPDKRRMSYVNRVVYFRKYAGELRITNVFKVLRDMYKSSLDKTVEIAYRHAFRRTFFELSKSVLMFGLGYEGMWLCASLLAVNGNITLSELIVLLNAIVSGSWMLNDFERAISNIMTNAFFIDNLKEFFSYVPKIDESKSGKEIPKHIFSLEFKNVSFSYPGQKDYALKNVNLTFNKGIRHALVGINGSGKSTLIKLILRFYDPNQGQILLNGIDIREFDIKKYRSLIGVAFQDFALFAATVTENVLLKETSDIKEKEKAVCALKDSDVYEKISTLPLKEDAVLTKEFDNDGVELSGGEKQKIAIARAFAKESPIVILDEPSSALDPIAEYKMFETITKLCKRKEKMSIIVSHRLSSAAVCEKIFVFRKGELVEEGCHKELINLNGVYANMFNKQAGNYRQEVGVADE